jgi:signal transduction histidine kinase
MSESANTARENRFWSKLPLVYRGALILAIPIISIIPAIVGWSWSLSARSDAFWWVNHTETVIDESNILLRILLDAETGIRGYTITQKKEFLEPYNQAKQELTLHLKQLKKLTADNSQQQQKLQNIERQIQFRLNILEQILNTVESQSQLELSSQLTELMLQGKAEMDALRNLIDSFQDAELQLLNVRQKHLNNIRKITDILIGITIASTLLSYWLAIKLYTKSETELEEKAKQLIATNKTLITTNELVESRNRELDKFTYIVSHDLKAPLRAIANLSQWIEEDLEDKLDEDTSKNMALLRSRVQRMDNFINGLLEYSRVGRIKSEKTTVDVQQLLHEIIDSIAPPPTFNIKIDENMPTLETEILPLQQIFSNLITNAIKHHNRDDGTITISVLECDKPSYEVCSRSDTSLWVKHFSQRREPPQRKCFTATQLCADGMAKSTTASQTLHFYQFSVADDGVGIAPKDQERIFGIFQTLTSRDEKENTGIGLSIIKKIIESQGEKIWLESQVNQGTTFYFTWAKS